MRDCESATQVWGLVAKRGEQSCITINPLALCWCSHADKNCDPSLSSWKGQWEQGWEKKKREDQGNISNFLEEGLASFSPHVCKLSFEVSAPQRFSPFALTFPAENGAILH